MKTQDFPIGKKIYAKYTDEFNELNINFIPMYVLEESDGKIIGTKNNMVGTESGYFNVTQVTGREQINSKYLSNIHIRNNKEKE